MTDAFPADSVCAGCTSYACCNAPDHLELLVLPYDLTVCKIQSVADAPVDREFFFLGKTDEEISLVCETRNTPADTLEREDGWKAFRIQGVLDFSLIGILSKISTIMSDNGIGIFAMSTYNTDYILVKGADLQNAITALERAGYTMLSADVQNPQ